MVIPGSLVEADAKANGMNQGLLIDVDEVMTLAVATGLFRSRCTIQAPDGTLGASGAPSGTYANVSGLVGIVAMDAPLYEEAYRIAGFERRSMVNVLSSSERHVLLDDYYSQLSPQTNWGDVGWRALMTDRTGNVTTYDIVGSHADSQQTQTGLHLQKARV